MGGWFIYFICQIFVLDYVAVKAHILFGSDGGSDERDFMMYLSDDN